MSRVSQQVRDSLGSLFSDIVNVAKQHTGDVDPDDSLGANGNLYTNTMTSQQFQKVDGTWQPTFLISEAVGGGGTVVTSGANLGGAEGVFDSVSIGGTMNFKGLTAGSNVSIVSGPNDITINASDTGEVNTASNIGLGANVFKQKVGSDLQFRKVVTNNSRLSINDVTDSLILDVQNVILGGLNSGLPAASQVYSGIGPGDLLSFKSIYAGSDRLNIQNSPDNLNIVFTPKQTEQYSGYVSQIGGMNSVLFWNYTIAPAVSCAFTLSDSSNKKVVKLCGKVLFNANWSYSAGSIAIDIGYFANLSFIDPANFVVLASTGLSLAAINQSIVWNAGINNYVVPGGGSLAVRVTNVGVTSVSNLADLMLTVHVQDV